MTWNYRMFRDENGDLGIIEVYHDEYGKPYAKTSFVLPIADTEEELKKELEFMLEAVKKPILSMAEFPFSNKIDPFGS